jgi:uncharacterized protein
VKDPNTVVKVGDRLNVWVLEVDLERKRISLTARKADAASATPAAPRRDREAPRPQPSFTNNPFTKLKPK